LQQLPSMGQSVQPQEVEATYPESLQSVQKKIVTENHESN